MNDFISIVHKANKEATYMACFPSFIDKLQSAYSLVEDDRRLHNRVLEPFYLDSNETWLNSLRGKKVLIVSPFVDDIKQQIPKLDQIWEKSQFEIPKDIHWVFYKPYLTLAGDHPHDSWKQTYDLMCHDISKLDFDVALLSCGGYGAPLSFFIHKILEKTTIYIGGGL